MVATRTSSIAAARSLCLFFMAFPMDSGFILPRRGPPAA